MNKRAETARETRGRIEAALMTLLASKSYASVIMGEIADEAGVSVRTVQRHYRSKDEILTASTRMPEREVAEEWASRPAQTTAEGAMRQLVDVLYAIYERYSAAVWATYSRAIDVSELRETLRVGIEARTSRIDDLLRRWPDAWAADLESVRRLLLGMTSYLTWRALTQMGGFTSIEATEVMGGLLCQGLLKGQ